MMNGFPEDKERKMEPEKKQVEPEEPKIVEEKPPETYFKSELLQKIERGENLHKKEEKPVELEVKQDKEQPSKQFSSKFVPRALWNK